MFQNKISSGQKKKNWLWIFQNRVEDLKLEYLCLSARWPNKNFGNDTLVSIGAFSRQVWRSLLFENFGASKKFLEHESFFKFFQKPKISLSNFVVEDETRSGCRKMNRAISSYSDTSSIDEETLLQQELARLQRQYRVMENERKEVNFYQIKNTNRPLRTDFVRLSGRPLPSNF